MKIKTVHRENRTIRYLISSNIKIVYRVRDQDLLNLGKYKAEISNINYIEGTILEYGDGDSAYLAVKDCIKHLRGQKQFFKKYLR